MDWAKDTIEGGRKEWGKKEKGFNPEKTDIPDWAKTKVQEEEKTPEILSSLMRIDSTHSDDDEETPE